MHRTRCAAIAVLGSLAAAARSPGDILFSDATIYQTPGNASVWDVEFGDFDHDDDLDMAAANEPINNGRISVYDNDGTGVFGAPVHYPTGGPAPTGLAVVDLDNNGWLDMAYCLFSPGSSVKVLINDTAGGFVATQTLYSGNCTGIAAADLSGDGWADVVTSNSQVSGARAKVFLNNGAGVLLPGVEYPVAFQARSVTIADLDTDEDLDLAVPSLSQDVVSVLLNAGNGTFAPMQNFAVGEGPEDAAAADLDGDGMLDLAVSSTGISFTSDVSVLMNTGGGGFAGQVTYDVGYDARGIVAEDFDGDGDRDVAVVVRPQSRVFVLANDGDGNFAPPVTFPCGAPGDQSGSLTAADLDGDGRIDLAVGNMGINESVALLFNRSPVPAPGDLDGDGIVGVVDLLALLAAWGPCPDPCPPACAADLDGDCFVGVVDLLAQLGNWG